jgi:hypothetical protein
MKRYWLFKGMDYYPRGGAEDYTGNFDSVEAAKAAFDLEWGNWANVWWGNWAHVFDTQTATIVCEVVIVNGVPQWREVAA